MVPLVNQHFLELCKALDEKRLAYGRGDLMRLMLKRRDSLNAVQRERLRCYFESSLGMEAIYNFMHELNELLRVKRVAANIYLNCLKKYDNSVKHPLVPCRNGEKHCIIGRKKWRRCFAMSRITA